jgi:hypothetical protein
LRDSQRTGPHDFALAHGDAARELRKVFAEGGRKEQSLEFS